MVCFTYYFKFFKGCIPQIPLGPFLNTFFQTILLPGNGKVVPLAWQSKKLNQVTKTPLASDAPALGEGADATHLIANNLPKTFFHFPKFQK